MSTTTTQSVTDPYWSMSDKDRIAIVATDILVEPTGRDDYRVLRKGDVSAEGWLESSWYRRCAYCGDRARWTFKFYRGAEVALAHFCEECRP